MKNLKDLLSFLFPKYSFTISNLLRVILGTVVLILLAYLFYLILRLLISSISSVLISIKDTKIELNSINPTGESGDEEFCIPSCSDYKYKNFYFGLQPYCNRQSKPKFTQRKSIQLQDAFFV